MHQLFNFCSTIKFIITWLIILNVNSIRKYFSFKHGTLYLNTVGKWTRIHVSRHNVNRIPRKANTQFLFNTICRNPTYSRNKNKMSISFQSRILTIIYKRYSYVCLQQLRSKRVKRNKDFWLILISQNNNLSLKRVIA